MTRDPPPVPLVLLCLGDPAGVGPELVARAMARPETHRDGSVCVVGDPGVLERARTLVGAQAAVVVVDDPRARRSAAERWPIVAVPLAGPVADGQASAVGGRAAGEAIARAVELVLGGGGGEAIAAAPSNKHALHLAGLDFDDHTAYLAHLTGTPEPVLMPVSDGLRVVSVTNHTSMARTCALISKDLVLRVTRNTAATLRQMGIPQPRLAVAALNPHGGEGGDFGDEEVVHIGPAVAAARAEGIDAEGPLPADSLFTPEKLSRYDAFITMYHDQGRIAQKALAFGKIVVITAGLPFFFATVGHGAAYDIAWQGRADAGNLLATLRHAMQAAQARARG